MDDSTATEIPTRRTVLRGGAWALAAAAGIGSFVSLRFLTPWPRERTDQAIVVGFPEEIAVGSIVVMPAMHAFVGRTEDGFYAVSSICPHLGCVVRWLDSDQRFHCPCHGSKFEVDGRVLNGPAREDLIELDVGIDSQGRVILRGDA